MAKTRARAFVFLLVVVGAVLAYQRADAASGQIPSLQAKVTSVMFFETPYTMVPHEKRSYSNRFGKGEPRFIGWELNLEHPAPGRRIDFSIEQLWYRANGSVLARQTLQTYIEPGWTWSYHNQSWGWNNRGNWPAGSYRVELYVGGQQVASGAFKIYAAPNEAITAYNQGNTLFRAKKYSAAIPYYDQAIRLYPAYAEAYSTRCYAYGELGNYAQAIADCNKSIQIDSDYTNAYSHRGAVYRRMGKYDEALANYNRALALNPNFGMAYLGRGFTYYYKEAYDQAWKDVARAQQLGVQVEPEDLEKLRKAAQAIKQSAQNTTPKDLADDIEHYDDLDRHVSRLVYEKKWQDAIRIGDQLIAKQPTFFGGYDLRAWVRLEALEQEHGPDVAQNQALREQLRPQLELIIADANQAVQVSETVNVQPLLESKNGFDATLGAAFKTYIRPKIYSTRARARHHAGDFNGAIADYNKATDGTILASAENLTGIGRAKAMQNDLRGALKEFDAVLFIYSDHVPAYQERARVYVRLRQFPDAIADFSRGLELIEANEIDDPLDLTPDQLVRLATVYGERAAAKRAARDQAGADQDASWQRALLHERDQQWSQAREAYAQLIPLAKTAREQAHAFYSRARTHSKLGEFDQALHDADRAIELDVAPLPYTVRAGIRRQRGDLGGAIEDYTRALGLLTEKRKHLYGVGLVSRAAAYRENQQLDLALADLKAVREQSLGYRQDARKHGVSGLVYIEMDQRGEADVSLRYARNNDEKFFDANIQPELDKLIGKKRRPVDPQVAKRAWELGKTLGRATFESLQEGGSDKSKATLAVASEHAKFFNVALPALPARGQSRQDDLRNALRFLHQSRDKIAPEIDRVYGRQTARCFDLAMSALTLQLVYQTNSPKLKSQALDAIKRAGQQSGIPESYWQPVLEKAEAAAPFNEFSAAVRHLLENVPNHFAAKSSALPVEEGRPSASEVAAAPPQEIAQIVARLHQNYKDALEFQWPQEGRRG